jgi:signal transduction histidine kinase
MKMRLLLIDGNRAPFADVIDEAMRLSFPGSASAHAASLDEALKAPCSELPEILVMPEAAGALVSQAVQALDDQRLPRWAVVVIGTRSETPLAEQLNPSDLTTALAARVLRTSLALHLLRRDKARLEGDMLSVGIRITHDLRTPIGGILSATDALSEAHAGHPRHDRAMIEPILESAQDLVKIVNQLSVLAKATARPDARQPFNMGTAAARAMERLEARVRAAGATISGPPAWPDVVGELARSEAVWQNLLDNALRHAGERPRIELGWEAQADGYRFWIRDNGAGVPREKRRLLFQPFHRLNETNAVRGLGLAVVERLVRLQCGRCGFEAPAEGGSCFFFTLPKVTAC